MSVRIQLRRDTAADWTAANPVLAQGEFGFERDTNLFKLGDGTHPWNALPYAGSVVVPSGDTSGATDLANLNAISAAGKPRRLQGTYYINGKVDLSGFLCAGSDFNVPLTRIVCVNAGAGVLLQKSGLITGGFCVDGNNVATQPLLVGSSNVSFVNAQSTYINIDVINSAQDGWVVQASQNCVFIGCDSQGSARDNLVLDYGCGGLDFIRFEGNQAGRYGLRILESGTAPAGVYTVPTDIVFHSGEFERGGASTVANIEACGSVLFDGTFFETSTNSVSSIVTQSGVGKVECRACVFQNDGGAPSVSAVVPNHNGGMYFTGANQVIGYTSMVDNTANVFVSALPGSCAGSARPFKSGTGDASSQNVPTSAATAVTREATGSVVEYGSLYGDAGQRYRRLADGSLVWGSGADFNFNTSLARLGAGIVGIGNTVHQKLAAPAYSASITPDASAGPWQLITVTNSTAFTINAPTNPPDSSHTAILTIEIWNNTAGAMGAVTWTFPAFTLIGSAFTNPGAHNKRFIRFQWNGVFWIEISRASADY